MTNFKTNMEARYNNCLSSGKFAKTVKRKRGNIKKLQEGRNAWLKKFDKGSTSKENGLVVSTPPEDIAKNKNTRASTVGLENTKRNVFQSNIPKKPLKNLKLKNTTI